MMRKVPCRTRKSYALLVCLGVHLAFAETPARAQTGSSESDSLRSYDLAEIVVGAATDRASPATVGTIRRVSLARLVRTDAPDVAGLARLVPSAHLQTNSRGESLIYLRGAGERQVAVFLDGALLNIPWDNRVDLSAVPASVLGGLEVTQGASSVLYGANVLGGVVNLATRSRQGNGSSSELTVAGGSGAYRRLDAMHIRHAGEYAFVAAAGLNRLDGFAAAREDPTFTPSEDGLVPNTDKRIAHGFVRLARTWNERTAAGLSVLHVDARKGIAAEGHLDPAAESVRYWRYPSWQTSMVAGNMNARLASGVALRGSAWASLFRQEIDQYATSDYADRTDRQRDRDQTYGMRLIGSRTLGSGSFRAALNGLLSRHAQVDASYPDGGSVSQDYQQFTGSVGAEYAGDLGAGTRYLLGATLDHFAALETGNKPQGEPFSAWGSTASLERDTRAQWTLYGTVGRKTRFPTMRELYGTALDRFVLSPDLRPESAWLVDLGARGVVGAADVDVTFFVNRTWDTIDQMNIQIDDVRKRQRINLDGSRILGAELNVAVDLSRDLTLSYSGTLSRSRVLGESDRQTLIEKPEALSSLVLNLAPGSRWVATTEAVYTGRAYGLDPDNELQALPRVVQVNVRLSARHYTRSGLFAEMFFRGDNLTDRAVYAQLGLPGPGRTLQLGLSLSR